MKEVDERFNGMMAERKYSRVEVFRRGDPITFSDHEAVLTVTWERMPNTESMVVTVLCHESVVGCLIATGFRGDCVGA